MLLSKKALPFIVHCTMRNIHVSDRIEIDNRTLTVASVCNIAQAPMDFLGHVMTILYADCYQGHYNFDQVYG